MRLFGLLAIASCLALGSTFVGGVFSASTAPAPSLASAAEDSGPLDAYLRELPAYDGTDAAFRSKYLDMTTEQLNEAYGILRSIYYEESRVVVDQRLLDGRYEEEVCDAAAIAELAVNSRGNGTRSLACKAEPLGDGFFLVKKVELPADEYPSLHVRMLETEWVHDQVHLREACTFCCTAESLPIPLGK